MIKELLWKNEAKKYILCNSDLEMTVSNLGATILSLKVRDKSGEMLDVVLGYEQYEEYANNTITYFGATIGRNCNRIANGKFFIGDNVCQMQKNENGNNLHSGNDGFQLRIWDSYISENSDGITFKLHSENGDQGICGDLDIAVTYTINKNNEVIIEYSGVSNSETIFNPTNHSYFNLNGHNSGTILKHKLQINANNYTPVIDSKSIPTGDLESVENTPMDFRRLKEIGEQINSDFEQLNFTDGYDHNFALDKLEVFDIACTAIGDKTGIIMEVWTDSVGVQFYSGNFLDGIRGKDGSLYEKRNGFCLETQYFPNAINVKSFVSPIIQSNIEKQSKTIYKFIIQK